MKTKKNKTKKPFKSFYDLDKKYILAILQILFFFFIILPMVIDLYQPIYVFPFIILEFISFIPLLYKKSIRYSIIVWLIQFYFAVLLNILFQPAYFFNVPELSTTASNTLILLLTLMILPLIFLIYFKEKMIKPVLFGLSTGTTIVVILIVGFIVMEGLPAFQHTNPVDFLTGEEWMIHKTKSYTQSEKLTAIIKNYDVTITPEDKIIYTSPNTARNITVEIKNTGGKKDNYSINYTTNSDVKILNLSQNMLSLNPQQKKDVTISFFSNKSGNKNINLSCISKNSQKKEYNDIKIIVGPYGVDLTPNTIKLTESQLSLSSVKLKLKNTGKYEETYIIKINSGNFFRPFVREIKNEEQWNYKKNQGNITLKPDESTELNIKLNMVNKVVGDYSIYVEARSKTHPEIVDNSTILFKQVKKDLFEINETKKTIASDQKAEYKIDTNVLGKVKIRIKNLPENFNVKLLKNKTVISQGQKQTIVDISKEKNNLTLIVTAENATEGDQANFSFELKTKGGDVTLGILQFLIGSFATTLIAILIAAPLGIGVAIFLSEFCHKKLKPGLRFIYDLLAGIPSVVYGLFGFLTFGPLLGENVFPFFFGTEPFTGRCLLTASLILSIMILPIIIALSEDAIRSVEKELKEGSLAMGATRWQTMTKVILPKAKSGIIASIILAVGRAIGETMAVSMIMGGSTGMPDLNFPNFFFDRVGTMTSEIALNFGWAVSRPESRAALFAIATMLFIIVFILNGIVFAVRKKSSKSHVKKSKNKKTPKSKIKAVFTSLFIFSSFSRKKDNKKNDEFILMDVKPKHKEKTKDEFLILDKNNNNKKNKNNNLAHSTLKEYFNNSQIMKTTKKALLFEKFIKIILLSGAVFATIMLLYLIADIIIKGGSSIELHYFFKTESFLNPAEGGFVNAIVGSLQLVGIALAVAAPLSIGAAIYIVEYTKKENIFTRMILFTSDTLASTPSIVFGAFGYIFFIFFLDFPQSLLVGGMTLGFMVIPLLLRSSIEALKSIPDSLREGSLALGATKWQTIKNAVIPPASPGISSGVIISMGRAIGETAAVIFTAGYLRYISLSVLEPVGSMPNLIWTYYSQGLSFPELGAKVYSAAMILLIIVIILNLISKLVAHRANRMMKE